MPKQTLQTQTPNSTPASAVMENMSLQEPSEHELNTKKLNRLIILPKLTVGAPDDPYEKEADAVTDKVMRMPDQNFVQRKCSECEEKEGKIHRKPSVTPLIQAKGDFMNKVSDSLSKAIQSSKGTGILMDSKTQSFMSNRFGRDFSNVKVHSDKESEQFNKNLNSNAFTVGNDIYFNKGQFQPNTSEGKKLMAHELTHVLQQKNNIQHQLIQREPTRPRSTTGNRIILEVERILTTARDTASSNETTRLWSNVVTNFSDAVTVGSIARRVWTYLFLRHFVEADSAPGVESVHPRYFYSHTYGWVDGQHFFGFIDFAEKHFNETGGNRQEAFNRATDQGLEIETNQQRIKDYVVLSRPPATDVTRFMQVQPPNTPAFRVPLAIASGAANLAAQAYASITLGGTQGELFGLLNDTQRRKFFVDSAKSAFTYEDFVSNQLGTRFFYTHGIAINNLPPSSRESAFRNALITFFNSINVENNPETLNGLAAGLPGQEQFNALKTTEQDERQRHPELFRLP